MNLAESLSPFTEKLEEVNETTEKMGEVIENNKPQPAIEHTPTPQPIENIEGVIYDTELENTLENKKKNWVF